MQVIGAGFGRTGTSSLRTALEMLGLGPCYHMFTIIEEPHRVRQWLAIGEGDPPDWDAVLAGFTSAIDWPAAAYWRELAEHYPAAKVILTVRDPERWYESVSTTIFARALEERHPPLRRRVTRRLVRWRAPDFALYPRMSWTTIMDRVFAGRIDDRAHVLGVLDRHIAEVKAAIPDGRLLVFDVAQGWEPLCEFLDVPVPDEPFPRSNDRAAWHRKRSRRLARLIVRGR
ncbi:sulfotransferase family protein [Actinomadura darangshiensis]|uniref:Sulfotransferase family protein n=1 Tax=Actinomadura darangshiensis TaxID=705336 RepID=A0A4R5A2I2_9ACTN|nr:sulfotransferase family protein [Actinomadura darangshiensis]TDD65026.1 sulfotransferase family protein [Actinomadura darangshiensis]